ncbi:MAG: 16S rRNA (uracil(1498)-N(3))-methyltransferase [Bacteroidota bacterium]
MQLFFTQDIHDNIAHLPQSEARHCIQVLRHREGDLLHFVDGQGNYYEGIIIEAHKKSCVLSIQKHIPAYNSRSFYLHIGIAPPKSIDRLEWFLEKATEIGINEITPLRCRRSERKTIRADRLEKVLLSAMKQSLKAQLPRLNELTSMEAFLKKPFRADAVQKFIAHCQTQQLPLLKENYLPGQDVSILIGPEGDFHPEEIEAAIDAGYQAISLGKSRLRTETAGIVACHSCNLLTEM